MRIQVAITTMLALTLLGSCGSSNQQVAETQKKLEETEKELAAAKEALAQKAESAGAAVKEGAAAIAPQGTRQGSSARRREADMKGAIEANKGAIEANKGAIETNKGAIAANKSAIEANKGAIATNAANIEKNRQGVEEAKKMAAPAPNHTLAAGTRVAVRTTAKISTKTNASGSLFEATLEQPLEVDGYLVAPRGATVEGIVVTADDGGRVKGRPTLVVGLRSVLMADGRRLPIKTNTVSEVSKGSIGKDATKVAIASGIGAAIGAIAGGGKGAAIGAGVGAGGGTAGILMTKGKPAEIEAEQVLNF